MRTRTFQPSLNDIPEDDYTYYSQSRPHSRSTAPATPAASNGRKLSFMLSSQEKEDIEDLTVKHPTVISYENVVSCDPQEGDNYDDSYTIDSLDGESEAESRASTLKRIAKRVNEKGTSLVSEIIKTLDKKNKESGSIRSKTSVRTSDSQTKVHQLVSVHSSYGQGKTDKESSSRAAVMNSADSHTDLIKPSMLRNVLKNKRNHEDSTTFENFCQEMIATFSRIKRYGDSKTPASTLGKKKKSKSASSDNRQNSSNVEQGDGKVRQWLEGLNKEGLYSDSTAKDINEDSLDRRLHKNQVKNGLMSLDTAMDSLDIHKVARKSTKKTKNVSNNSDISKAYHSSSAIENLSIGKTISKSRGAKDHDNTYEEIKSPIIKNDETDDLKPDLQDDSDNSSSYSEDSVVSQIKKQRNHISKHSSKIAEGLAVLDAVIDDELNTSFDPDTLERQPKKLRSSRSRSVLKDKHSDYCTSDSEGIYDAMSLQSSRILPSESSERDKIYDSNGVLLATHIQTGDLNRDPVHKSPPPLPPKQSGSPDTALETPNQHTDVINSNIYNQENILNVAKRISPERIFLPPKSNPLSRHNSEMLLQTHVSTNSPPSIPRKKNMSVDENARAPVIINTQTSEPPLLPQKLKKLSRDVEFIDDDKKIPELSVEAAATILHGLQARTSPLDTFSTSETKHKDRKRPSSSSFKSKLKPSHSFHLDRKLNKKLSPSKKTLSIAASHESLAFDDVGSSAPAGEERVRGQFILAPEGKSPASSRRSSFSRSGRGSVSRSSSSDTDVSGKNVKLCQCAKSELEKHFIEKEKPNADTIKKTWRKVMEKSGDESTSKAKHTNNNSRLTDIDEEKQNVGQCKKCTKQKQEDSGYQSSDSCNSNKSNSSSTLYESSCSIDLESGDDSTHDVLSNKNSGFGPQIFPKSHSFQHFEDHPVEDVYRNYEGSQCSSRASSNNSVVSVYENKSHNLPPAHSEYVPR